MKTLEQKAPESAKSPAPHDDVSKTEKSHSSPRLWLWFLVALLLVGVGLAVGVIPRLQARRELAADTQELGVSTVNVVNPAPGKAAPELVLTAEIRPYQETPIYARANGYLKKWYVDIGAHVEAGQLLVEIDTPEVNQALASARAELARDEASLGLAKITADRWADLLTTSSVSEQEAAEKKSDLALKAAVVEATKANVHRLEDLQSFDRITAPFAGTITIRNVDVGDLIAAGNGKELFRLAQTQTLRVFVRAPQTIAANLVPGLTAELILPEKAGHKYPAKITRTAGQIDASSRTLLVELEVDNSKNEILAGSYAQVIFTELNQDMALVVPSPTLISGSDGMHVAVVDTNDRVELRKIILGRDFGRSVEVLSGITVNDRLIINPSDALASGVTVRIAEAAKTEKKP